jgi:hypothetical protein
MSALVDGLVGAIIDGVPVSGSCSLEGMAGSRSGKDGLDDLAGSDEVGAGVA